MHEPPTWTRTASDNAMITRDELLLWLDIQARDVAQLIANRGLPRPRRAGIWNTGNNITKTCQWRVGDVRAWLRGRDVAAETLKPLSRRADGKQPFRVCNNHRRIEFGSGHPKTSKNSRESNLD